ncbi:histone-lysine N-methyltransferase SETDB1 [Eurytemora carolleeae]|uniref:histone-lysine N-methyltransferase SETDB1 n=1 Tax=Eurytemora carolleeae TaxID=1294199 RepID=UPI000C789CBF|nr:histone-lysine N-methyltransferase SETDB1 [Eurytemora carolleeae]|eukprot:XP_023339442.1 histone-lysine N-methyltransferase SETDB1-like [Eurytemora affinis]
MAADPDNSSKELSKQMEEVTVTDSDDDIQMDSVSTPVPANNAVDELSNGPAKNVAADTQNGLTALSKILDNRSDSDSSVEIQEPKKRRKIIWACLVPDCNSTKKSELITANGTVLSYFKLQRDEKKKRKICISCREKLAGQEAMLVERLKNKQPILGAMLPLPEVVNLEDSDQESETDDSESTEFELDLSSEFDDCTAEEALRRIMQSTLEKYDVKNQFDREIKEIQDNRENVLYPQMEAVTQELIDLQMEVDKTRNELYAAFEPERISLPPLDLDSLLAPPLPVKPLQPQPPPLQQSPAKLGLNPLNRPNKANLAARPKITARPNILMRRPLGPDSLVAKDLPPNQVPPPGVLERPPLTFGDNVYMLRGNSITLPWKPGKLAYESAPTVRLTVSTRCIALYREKSDDLGEFYAGIIAEPPKSLNNNRYLVFFDDGVARYIEHKDIRVVCQSSPDVSDDIHPNSSDFIKNYLSQYPERPMVKLFVGQVVKTEYDGKWHITRVKQVDGSLVKLSFDQDDRVEWIYRGSTRLGPLFTEREKQKIRLEQGPNQVARRHRRENAPLIEYTRQVNDADLDADGAPVKKQNVARKSMGNRDRRSDNNELVSSRETDGNTHKVDISERRARGKPYEKHQCSSKCIQSARYKYDEAALRGTNPLLIPLIVGWDRQETGYYGKVGNARRSKKIMYTAPCGRRLRNLDEVHRYLRITGSQLEIDFFIFDWFVQVFNEFEPTPSQAKHKIQDLSYGKENVPISLVNTVDNSYIEYVEYSTTRIPKEKVFINTSKDFLIGCDCEDDCQDKDSCACHQLTIQGTKCDMAGKLNPNAGYKYRRLYEHVSTGIYECNQKCKCAKTCLNRVAQHPLRNKLQVFKTQSRGWGVRTLVDMPQGAFICIYVGNLFEADEGNKQGQNYGDEYFADLDMIEMVEKRKEGYESDVSDEELEKTNFSFTKESYGGGIDDVSTEDEDDNSGEKNTDKDFNPICKLKKPPKNTDRISRSKLHQVDGVGDSDSSSDSDNQPSDTDIHPIPDQRVDINSLIKKPDPFKNNMVRPNLGEPVAGRGPEVYVQHPGQVDGAADYSDDEEDEDARKTKPGFTPLAGIQGPGIKKTFKSTRKFFGHNEEPYIMDAKSTGNIGRYLNHCCDPNCFVQSVFVDTHDLRFHWVAFFSQTFIPAGTELNWDYAYEVDTIEGRKIDCKCNAAQCRGRLL